MLTLKGPVSAAAWFSSQPMDGGLAQASPSISVPWRRRCCRRHDKVNSRSRGSTGQLWVGTDVAETVWGHGHRATVVERAGSVIVAPKGVRVKINDAVAKRAAIGAAAGVRS